MNNHIKIIYLQAEIARIKHLNAVYSLTRMDARIDGYNALLKVSDGYLTEYQELVRRLTSIGYEHGIRKIEYGKSLDTLRKQNLCIFCTRQFWKTVWDFISMLSVAFVAAYFINKHLL